MHGENFTDSQTEMRENAREFLIKPSAKYVMDGVNCQSVKAGVCVKGIHRLRRMIGKRLTKR